MGEEKILESLGLDIWGASGFTELPPAISAGAFIFIFLLCLAAILFRFSRRARGKTSAPGNNLFLKVDYIPGAMHESRCGYLRSLTLERASVVAPDRHLERGAVINLVLNPECEMPSLPGKIVKRKSLGGSPENWLFDVRFTDKSAPASHAIKQYLQKAIHRQIP